MVAMFTLASTPEQITAIDDAKSGLSGWIVVHSTALGAAAAVAETLRQSGLDQLEQAA